MRESAPDRSDQNRRIAFMRLIRSLYCAYMLCGLLACELVGQHTQYRYQAEVIAAYVIAGICIALALGKWMRRIRDD